METPHRHFHAAPVARWFAGFALALALLDAAIGMGLDRLYATVGRGQLIGMIHSAIAARADVLLLGASTVRHHLDDRALTERLGVRVFNTGLDGRGVMFSRGLLALVRRSHAPKLVVMDVNYSDRDHSSARLLAPFYHRDPVVDQVLTWNWRERLKLVSHAYRYNGLLFPMLTNLNTPPMRWGFEPLDGSVPDTARFGGPLRGGGGFGPWYGVELRKLVSEARAGGARIIFVESPTWGAKVAPAAIAEYERVSREMNVPYYRLTPDRVPELNQASLYYDRAHLNRRGAALFTDLVAPILANELAAR
jgi:hypothetical protein